MPMLDLYVADTADGAVKARGRVFTPRPVTYRVRAADAGGAEALQELRPRGR